MKWHGSMFHEWFIPRGVDGGHGRGRSSRAATLREASGVPVAPKELRAAFVTHLKSSENDDRVLKAAAVAMRHSSKVQDSAAYNKDKHDRLVSAAVKAAEKYASRFMTS